MAKVPVGNFGFSNPQLAPAPSVGPGAFVSRGLDQFGEGAQTAAVQVARGEVEQGQQDYAELRQVRAEQKQALREQQAEDRRTLTEAKRAEATTIHATTQNDLYAAHDEIINGLQAGTVSKDDAPRIWAERSKQITENGLLKVDTANQELVKAGLTGITGTLGRQINLGVVKRAQQDIGSGLNSTLEELQRAAVRDPTAVKRAEALLDSMGPQAGLNPEQIGKQKQTFKEGAAFNSLTEQLNANRTSYAGLQSFMQRVQENPDLDPGKKNALLNAGQGQMLHLQNVAEAAERRRAAGAERAIGVVEKTITAGLAVDPKTWATVQSATKGTPYAPFVANLMQSERDTQTLLAKPIPEQIAAVNAAEARALSGGRPPGPDVSDLRLPSGSYDAARFGKRQDGTAKGTGFLGVLKTPSGDVATEYTVGVQINGKQMDIPTLVPTLSRGEVEAVLRAAGDRTGKIELPDAIVRKAADFARQRLAEGKSVFATPDDQALMGPGGALAAKQNADRLKKTVGQNIQTLTQTPLVYAVQRQGADGTPLDLINVASWGDILQNRLNAVDPLSKQHGVPKRLLLPAEAQQLASILQSAPTAQQAQLFNQLEAAIPDPKAYRDTIAQIAPDDPVTAYAGALFGKTKAAVREGTFSSSAAPDPQIVARTLLEGRRVLAPTKGEKGQDGSGRGAFKMPADKDFDAAFESETKGMYAGNPEARSIDYQAARAFYAGAGAQQGKFDGVIDDSLVRNAVTAVTGGISSKFGRVARPYGWSEDQFRDSVRRGWMQTIVDNKLPATLRDSRIQLRNGPREGAYYVMDGSKFLAGRDGAPIMLDVTR